MARRGAAWGVGCGCGGVWGGGGGCGVWVIEEKVGGDEEVGDKEKGVDGCGWGAGGKGGLQRAWCCEAWLPAGAAGGRVMAAQGCGARGGGRVGGGK